MDLIAAIKHQMQSGNITQLRLCNRIGISRSYLYKILNGIHIPSILMVEKIAKGLQMRPSDLIQLAEEIDPDLICDQQCS
ncbi:MAG: helix-turn-helix transcriptional regulator [Sphaerochaetaceae bacterium]|jgi:transcriptional regulator with XRE-family HTH domain|nr:helix-turn-helix domain-containing protein [Sphaerochaetaceae bacterium]NLO61148.1 helix-turn-helix transcriptional regulator [Spirochaetales bacterium]MDD2407184.1 helix-turn-helix transcriptional regulator [Sphaerochaetaceae bacterium]MDD4260135.1 helix-turn-helix transcriptional regulator [Sphaerochaetaceae bacterium]MDD4764122.1 helix-turn-helix transcriptional regulator [Sphaerochaetaceae bacterium]